MKGSWGDENTSLYDARKGASMETSIPAPPVVESSRTYIAPWWHTVLLLVFLLGFSAMGAAGHPGLDHSLRLKLYISTMVMEWVMVLFIWWGLRQKQTTTIGDMEQRIGSMLPDGKTEILTWLCLCATAGFCEEVIFRGYFQKQFGALLGSVWGGMAVQALIFGGSHGYEGWRQMVRIAVFGFMFGMLAWWRKSLRPGMMAHFAQDGIAGTLGRWAIENANKMMPR
jgi:uncharacterized protein